MKALFLCALCLGVGGPVVHAQWDNALVAALRQHQSEKIRQAIAAGYPINAVDGNGANLLMWAVYTGDLYAAEYLVTQGATSPARGAILFNNRQSSYGSLPAIAAGQGNLVMLRYLDSTLLLPLDEKEYSPGSGQNDGWSPLIWAVSNNRTAIVNYLIGRHVSLSIFDKHHSPLLSFASHKDNMAMLRLLLDAGADAAARDSAGRNLLDDLNHLNHTHVTSLSTFLSSNYNPLYDSLLTLSPEGRNRIRYKSLAGRAAAAAQKDFGVAARQLILVGDACYNQDAYSAALPIYLEVARERRTGDDEDFDYALLLDHIGICYSETDQQDSALSYYKKSANHMEKLGPDYSHSYGGVLSNLAHLYETRGEHQRAIGYFQQSIAANRRSAYRNPLDIVKEIFELGDIFQNLDDSKRAAASYEEGTGLLDSCQVEPDSANAMRLNGIALKLREAGSYSEALAAVERAIEMIADVKGRENLAYADFVDNAGGIYQLMDIYDKQLKYCLEALHIREKLLPAEHDDVITSLNNVGFAYDRNNRFSIAIDYYKRAKTRMLANEPLDSAGYATLLHNLARCYTSIKDYKRALPLHYQELRLSKLAYGENSADYALSLNTMADFYEAVKDYPRALAYYKKDLALERRLHGQYHYMYLEALTSVAEMYLLLHSGDSAARLFIQSNRDYQRYLRRSNSFLSDEDKMTVLDEDSYRYDMLPSMLYAKLIRHSTPKVAREIYDEQLFIKGLVLQDQREVMNTVQQSNDSVTRGLFQQWKEARTLEGRQMLLAAGQQTFNLDSLGEKSRLLEQKLAARSFAFQQSQKIQAAGTGEIGRALKEGEAAIEFIKFDLYQTSKHGWGDSTVYGALLLRHNDSIPMFLPLFEETQLYNVITDDSNAVNTGPVVSDLYEQQDEADRQAPGSLYSLIWKPLAASLKGIRKIYYSPVGLLNLVSFDAIKISRDHYLLDSIEMIRTSSTRSICFAGGPSGPPKSAALWGNIRYGWDSSWPIATRAADTIAGKKGKLRTKRLTRGGSDWVMLDGAKAEVDSIAAILTDNRVQLDIDSGRDATEERFKRLDGASPELIHISTHGFFLGQKKSPKVEDSTAIDLEKQDNPMFRSALVLAGANNQLNRMDHLKGADDGILTAYEVANLSLANTRLVVLSACQTGLGEVKGSEGVFGMQRAFKIAGVGQIVATLWSIDDSETVELISLFYHNLFTGIAARDALRAAQQTMRKDHPAFIWGAFVLVD